MTRFLGLLAAAVALAALSLGCPSATSVGGACGADADCGAGSSCAQGVCVTCPPCREGEACIAGMCLPALCGDLGCHPGQGCLNDRCVDSACLTVTCPAGQACARGSCYPRDCSVLDCSEADVCFNEACVSPACVGVTCGGGETCVNGRCLDQSCAGVQCAKGAACVEGRCAAVACVGVVCPAGSRCAAGRCLSATGAGCPAEGCPAGLACQDGGCRQAGCIGVTCEPGSRCWDGTCLACVTSLEASCGDGSDDDCDGRIDCDDPDCAGSSSCHCPQTPCDSGESCVGGTCLPASCGDHPCHAGEGCKEGACVAADCLTTSCGAGQACVQGVCLPKDCPDARCGAGEVCVDNSRCTYTGCVGTLCGGGEVCADRRCLSQACGDRACAAGAACEGGACRATSCIGIACPADTFCARGRCLPTTGPGCPVDGCPAGQACTGGTCEWHDCDGLRCPGGQVCVAGACEPAAATETSCTDGRDNDGNGQRDCADPACGEVAPCRCLVVATELSCTDGVDDDCDELLDCLDPDCTGAAGCGCPLPCGSGETCVGSSCLPSSCGDHPCHAGEGCLGGSCVAADCLGTACGAGEACAKGVCLPQDCPDADCAPGEVCVNGAYCAYTGCVGKLCGSGQACADGRCLPQDCGATSCAAGAACEGGACLATSCIGITCPGGTVCAQGRCLPTTGPGCPTEGCPTGQACVSGACGWHDCDGLSCPSGQVCVAGACEAAAATETSCTDGRDNDGDGQLDCADSACAAACHCPSQATASEAQCADGIDDDCDGLVDCADPECAGAAACGCPAVPCASGEHCVGGSCLPASCGDHPCHAGEGCRDGTCVAADCLGTTCAADQACAQGVCLPRDCPSASCAAGDVCLYGTTCVFTGCVGKPCPGGQVCADGRCLPAGCGPTSCAAGAACEGGACRATSCIGISCPGGTVCAQGRCLPTTGPGCPIDGCPAGQACVDGACGWHDCDGLACPSGEVCVAGACAPAAPTESSCTDGRDNDGNGQLDCADPACGYVAPCRCLTHSTEANCADGVDDDCDGSLDCADPDCLDAACGAATACGRQECNAAGACEARFELAGTICRARTGPCDLEEACTGAGPDCPPDAAGGCSPAVLGLSDGPTFDFGSALVGTSRAWTFTVTNVGGWPATLGAVDDAGLGLAAPYSLVGGTCTSGASLAPGDSCSLLVAFSPSVAASSNDTIILGFDDGLSSQDATRPVTGTGTGAARLALSHGPAFDFGTRAVGSSASQTFVVTNVGGWEATLGPVNDAGLGLAAPYSVTGGSCATGATLAPATGCTLVVTYAPASAQLSTDAIDLAYQDGTSAQTASRTITGMGANAALLTLSDAPTLDFGARSLGSSTSRTLTVTNSGGWTATLGTVSDAALGLAAPFALAGGTCATGLPLPPAGSCTLVVGFVPTSAGFATDSLDLPYDDGATPRIAARALQGTGSGSGPAVLSISGGPAYDFGDRAVGSGTTQTFTVVNAGGYTATLGAVDGAALGLAAPFTLAGGSCTSGMSLPPGDTCTLVVAYAPTVSGLSSESLELAYDDGVGAQMTSRALAGTGVSPALLTLSGGPAYDFGTRALGSGTTRTFTATNLGGFAATLGPLEDANLGLAAPFGLEAGGSCSTGASLAPGNSCTLVVRYAPTAAIPSSDSLELGYHDGAVARTASRALAGTGANPALLSVSHGPTYDFGSPAVGSSLSWTFTVTNVGDFAARLGAVTSAGLGLASPYALGGGSCASGALLAAGDSCTLQVAFAPAATGAFADSIELAYDDGASSRTGSRALFGAGASPALLVLSDFPTYDFGTRALASSTSRTFTVTNSGGVTATLESVSSAGLDLAAPYSLSGGTCATTATLPPGGSCTLVVRFAPAVVGATSEAIELAYQDGAAAQTASRSLSGTGAPPALLTVSDGPIYSFTALAHGTSASKTFTVTNSGGVAATLGAVTDAGLGVAAPYALTGGTCATSASLAAGASCTLTLRFAPSSAGTFTDSLDLAYDDGSASQTVSRTVSGTGASPAVLSLSDGPTYDFGTRALGSSAVKTFTVTNLGNFAATLGPVSSASLGLAVPYTLTGGSCATGGSLAPAGVCTLVVTYAPLATGPSGGTIVLSYQDGAASQSVSRALTGTGASPALLALSDGPTYTFGTRPLGSSTTKTFTVTNSGALPATLGTVTGAALGLTAPYTLIGGTCSTGAVLAASTGSCTLVVAFAPTTTGAFSGSIDLGYHNGASPQIAARALAGAGADPALLTLSDGPTWSFGTLTLGTSGSKTFTVSNSGGVDARLGAVNSAALGLAAPYALAGGTCATGATLAASTGTCTLVVSFTPTASGAAGGTIVLPYDDGVAATTATRALAGAGSAPARLSLSDDPAWSFGTLAVGASASKTFTVTNSGGSAATLGTVSSLALGLTGPYALAGGTCASGETLAAFTGSCTLVVSFAPAAAGSLNDSLDLAYNDGATGQTAARALTGTGANPAVLTLSDGPTYDFGTLAFGASATRTFTVANSGGFPATLGTVTGAGLGLAAPYALVGGTCATGALVSPAGSCTLVVSYAPTAAGVSNDSLALSYQNGASSQTASRALTGTGANPAVLDLSDGPTYDFGARVVGSSTSKSFTVTNSGGVPATLGAVSDAGLGLAAPYALAAGGTCATGASLAPSGTCTLIVRYGPTAPGASSEAIDLAYGNGASSQTASRALAGTGASPALLGLSDGPTYGFGTLAVGASASKTFTVTNSGGFAATLGTVTGADLGLAAPYALTGGTCLTGATLAASGGACTLVVSFAPSSSGTYGDSLDLAYHDGHLSQSASRAVSGTGASPALLTLSDGPTYDFGTRAVGSTASKAFTVTNTGGFTATLGTLDTAGLALAAPYTLTGGTCATGASLAPAGSCTLVVTYAPTATGGSADSIGLAYANGASLQTASRALTGTAASPALLTLSDGPSFSFGTRAAGSSAAKTFTVTNSGSFAATLGTMTGAGVGLAAPYSLADGTCATGASLAPAGSCTLTVTYAPTAAGASSDSLDVGYHDGASARIASRTLSGTGANPALLAVSGGATYDFGTRALGSSTAQTFTVTNSGGFPATLGAVTGAGLGLAEPYALTGGTCATGAVLAASTGTCTLVVRFAPTAVGAAGDTLTLGYDDGVSAKTFTRPLTGSGAAPALLSISDGTTYDFATRAVGSTTPKTFTVTNLGGVAATLGTVDAATLGLAAPFTLGAGGTCATGASLSAAASCTLVVTFAPAAPGPSRALVTLGYDDGTSTRSASRPLTGTGASPASLTISGAPDFGYNAVGMTVSRTFTVTNGGDFPAVLGTVADAGLAAPFARTGGSCASAASLLPGESCTLLVAFAPTVAGTSSDSIDVGYDDGATFRPASLAVTGTAGEVPSNASQPTISGSPVVGQLLRANDGTWTGTQPITISGYQWQRCDAAGTISSCTNVSGATDKYFRLTGAEVGGTLRVDVSAKNAFGSAISKSLASGQVIQGGATPGSSNTIYALAVQPDQKRVVAGYFNRWGGTFLENAARFNADGSLDPSFVPTGSGFDGSPYDAVRDASGRLVIGGGFGSYAGIPRGRIARLNPDGSLDSTFTTTGMGFNNSVTAVALDSAGRILVGGAFSAYDSVPRSRVARLHSDGSLDTSFATVGTGLNSSVQDLALDPSTGKILVGGYFTNYDGVSRPYVARLNVDGSLDTSFAPAGTGLNSTVYSLAVDGAGRVVVGGDLTSYNGVSRPRVARLNADGTLDTTFAAAGTGANTTVNRLALDDAGRVLVGGVFTSYAGSPRNRIARLNSDGTLDTTFVPVGSGLSEAVNSLALDGTRVLVGGTFKTYNGISRPHLARLASDGSLDASFAPTGTGLAGDAGTDVRAIVVEPSGRVAAFGVFNCHDGAPRGSIARLNADGSIDPTFTTPNDGFGYRVVTLALDAFGRVVAGGDFNTYGGISRRYLARLLADGTLDTTFVLAGTGLNGRVAGVAVDASGRLVIAGAFTSYNGTALARLARLNSDGSLDATFAPPALNDAANSVAIDSSNRIVVGGAFTSPGRYVARFNPDGSLDATFAATGSGLSGIVNSVASEPSGRVIVGGAFTSYNGTSRRFLARLNQDGSLDTSFTASATLSSAALYSVAIASTGRILAGGLLSFTDGVERFGVARFLSDGSLDPSFTTGAGPNGSVHAVAADATGRVIAGGAFTTFDGLLARGYWEF